MIPQLLGERVATYAACVVMAGIIVAILTGGEDRPAPPAVTATPSPVVRSRTYQAWRAATPATIATEDEVRVALIEAGMPHEASRQLARAAVECESPKWDRDGESIGADLHAVGDQGRAIGPFQIRVDVHKWAQGMYLPDLQQSAQAAVRVWREQGAEAWACW